VGSPSKGAGQRLTTSRSSASAPASPPSSASTSHSVAGWSARHPTLRRPVRTLPKGTGTSSASGSSASTVRFDGSASGTTTLRFGKRATGTW
jgi:hypothetical protein